YQRTNKLTMRVLPKNEQAHDACSTKERTSKMRVLPRTEQAGCVFYPEPNKQDACSTLHYQAGFYGEYATGTLWVNTQYGATANTLRNTARQPIQYAIRPPPYYCHPDEGRNWGIEGGPQ
ncbi:MAG: hypothetical protein ACPGWR_17210, partial [Ardenticatenaceae bacterium]